MNKKKQDKNISLTCRTPINIKNAGGQIVIRIKKDIKKNNIEKRELTSMIYSKTFLLNEKERAHLSRGFNARICIFKYIHLVLVPKIMQ